MRNIKTSLPYWVIVILSIFISLHPAWAQTFTNGNLAVFVAAASSSNTTGSIVEINTTSPAQSALNTYTINGTSGGNALRFSGSATSTCYMSNSNDGTLLLFTGGNTTISGTVNINTITARGVGSFNHGGTFSLATAYTGTSGNQTRCATTLDNTNYYIGDQGGQYTNGTSSGSPVANLRAVKSFGGTVYAGQASGTATNIQVSTSSSLTGGSLTGLAGLTNNASLQDFCLVSSGSNGSAYDVLYVLSATSNTAGTIAKYSLVSGTWTANGSYTTTFGGFGLTAQAGGGGAYLYLSTGQGALTANSVLKVTDVAGYNTSINITTASNVALYTAAAGTIIKGVAFAPICNAPAVTSTSVNGPICANNTLNFTSSGTGLPAPTFSWVGPNSFTASTQNPSLSNAQTVASGVYTVTATNLCGVATGTISGTVNALPSPTITANSSTTFCSGGSVDLSTAGANSYTWQPGSANTQTITVTSSGNYSVSVTDANGCNGTSAVTAVTVNPNVTPSVVITPNPGATICSGTSVSFSATPSNGGTTPGYQWILNGSNVGTNSSTYSNSSLINGDQVACVLTSNANCAVPTTANSNTIMINVSSSVVPSVTISVGNTTNCQGATVTFTATPTNGGATPGYQWMLNGGNVGINSSTYSNNSVNDQDQVSCVLTSSDGCASPAMAAANTLTMTVTATATPAISISANPGSNVCSGASVTFSATPTNGGLPAYQWLKNGSNVGTNSASYTDAALTSGDAISCVLTSNAACVTTNTVASSVITMTVNALPPTPTVTGTFTFCAGGSTVLDAGSGYTSYLWSSGGATTQTISVNTATTLSVTVSNGTCNYTSAAATTTVVSAPSQPGSFTASSPAVNVGQNNVVYTVPNDPAVTYSWNYSGTGATINGTGNSVTVDFSGSATSGTISVTASNLCGTSTAQSMLVSVNPANFTTGNLVVLMTANTASKASSQITLKEFTTSGTPGASIAIPTTGSYPLQTAGVFGGSEGFLTRSADGRFLVLAGYATTSSFTDITATSAASVTRAVGTVSQSGSYTQVASSNSFYSLNDIRGAVSDGTNFWTSGASAASVDGIDYFGPGGQDGLGTVATPPKGYGIRLFNGQIYYSTQKAGPNNTTSQLGIFSLSGGTPIANPVTVAQVINTGTLTPEDFSFNPTSDICYIAINLNTANGGIQKWTRSGSTWSLAYTLGTGIANTGAYGIEVDYSGVNAVIYATTFDAGGNRIIKITDTGAGSAATNIVAATAGVFYKGITFAPIAAGIPVVNLSVSTNTATETAQTAVVVTATSSSPVTGTQTVALGVSGTNITGTDYNLSGSVITIPNGATTGTVTFTIADDALNEGTEVASLTISSPSTGILLGGIVTQTISIIDNDGNNPPTIAMNVVSTTNLLDGGAPTSPASPFAISGVSNDPSDPASTIGIDFVISDIETAASSLTVTATSSNTSVVPSSSVTVSGSGAIRNVKIKPVNVGFSDITVAVSDGVNNASYVLTFGSSQPTPVITPSNTFWHTGMSDGSDAVVIDDNYYMSGDDEVDLINVYPRNASGLEVVSFNFASFLNLPDPGHPEVDVEAGTPSVKQTGRSYWLGSMSNGKAPFANKPNRDRLFATNHTGTGSSTIITFAGYTPLRSDILAWGDAHGYDFTTSAAAGQDSKAFNGYAAEGMVFGPDSTTLWIAFRAPLVPTNFRTKAVICPVLNFETWFNNGSPSGSPTFGSPIELDLNMNGIRDIIRLSNGNYIIIAGGPIDDAGTTQLYKWTGNTSDAPISMTTPADGILNMEGAMEVHTGGNLNLTKLQVVSDLGANDFYNDGIVAKDYGDLDLRKFRSDVLTGIDLSICTGFAAGITASGSTTFCAGDSVTLTANSNMQTYAWSNGGTTQSVTVKNSGAYTVTITNGGGCSATATRSVTVHSLPNVQAAATPTAVCSGNPLTLSGSGAASYAWSNGVTNGLAFTPTVAATYTVTGTDNNGCKNKAAITVNLNTTPTIAANSSTTTVCAGQSVTLTGGGATTYTWTGGVVDGVAFAPTNTATYTVTGSDGTCSNTAVVTVTVNPLPATPTVSVNGNILSSSPAISYQWYFNGGLISGATSQTYTTMQTGSYGVEITDANGCSAISNTVSVNTTLVSLTEGQSVLMVKPNPFANSFEVEFYSADGKAKINLYNSLGEQVPLTLRGSVATGKNNWLVQVPDFLPQGIYYLQLQENGLVRTLKLSRM